MRNFHFLVAMMLALLITDAAMFDGRYRAQAWAEAKQAGTRFNFHLAHQLRRMGLGG
jgi:hypothetical protein